VSLHNRRDIEVDQVNNNDTCNALGEGMQNLGCKCPDISLSENLKTKVIFSQGSSSYIDGLQKLACS